MVLLLLRHAVESNRTRQKTMERNVDQSFGRNGAQRTVRKFCQFEIEKRRLQIPEPDQFYSRDILCLHYGRIMVLKAFMVVNLR